MFQLYLEFQILKWLLAWQVHSNVRWSEIIQIAMATGRVLFRTLTTNLLQDFTFVTDVM